jgi:hypothetical protein
MAYVLLVSSSPILPWLPPEFLLLLSPFALKTDAPSQYSSAGTKVPARTRYREPKRAPPTGGVVLKVSLSDQLQGGKQTQFEYAIGDNQIYYDISFVDCAIGESASNCPGWEGGLNMDSPEVRTLTPLAFLPCPIYPFASRIRLTFLRNSRLVVQSIVRRRRTVLKMRTLSILRCRSWASQNPSLGVEVLEREWIFGCGRVPTTRPCHCKDRV